MNKIFYAFFAIFFILLVSCGVNRQTKDRDPDPRFVMFVPDIPIKLFFTENYYKLSSNQEAVLDTVVEFLLLKPNYYVIVSGYQNNNELPRTANNRADNIRDYIYRMGIPAGKILVEYLVTKQNIDELTSEQKLDLYRTELILRKY